MHFFTSFLALVAVTFTGAAALVTPELEARDNWSDEVLKLHNSYRAQYGAKPLSWDEGLYNGAKSWAEKCDFRYSNGLNYGENLAYAKRGFTFSDIMKIWMNEGTRYDYSKPGPSISTNDFTQIVWKATTKVGCAAYYQCPLKHGIIGENYFVCHYSRPGNVIGQFPQNVGRQRYQ